MRAPSVGYVALLAAVIAVGVANAVLLRKLLYTEAGDYVVSLTVLLNSAAVVVLLPLHLAWERRRRRRSPPRVIDQYDAPWWFFLAVAALDGVGSFLALLGGSRTSGSVQLLIGKADIPLAMAFTLTLFRRTLGASYHLTHFIGAGVVLAGITVVALPPIFAGDDARNTPTGVVLFSLSAIPLTVSEVLKEAMSKRYAMDPLFLNAWTAPWQLLVSIVTLPALVVPGVTELRTPGELGANLADGLLCLAAARCPRATVFTVVFFVVNISYNFLAIAAMRRGSAVVTSVVQAAQMPIAALVYASALVMGVNAVPLTWPVGVALVLVLTGLVVYVLRREHPPPPPGGDEIPLTRLDLAAAAADTEE
jgi:hypothetical protein